MSELKELLAKSSSMSGRSGVAQKLKALQLVEQMIAEQEQLVANQGEGAVNCPFPPNKIDPSSSLLPPLSLL